MIELNKQKVKIYTVFINPKFWCTIYYPKLPKPCSQWFIFSPIFFFSFTECHINKSAQYVTFYFWLSISMMYSRFIHIVLCTSKVSFLFLSNSLLYGYTMFIFPFSSWRTFELFQMWSDYELYCSKHSSTDFCLNKSCNFPWVNT